MKKIFLFVLYFWCFFGFSQIKFNANVRNVVYENEFFQVSFVLSFDGDPEIKSFNPPNFNKSFDIDKIPQMSSSENAFLSNINGKKTVKKENLKKYTYNLKIKKSGEYIIPPASIVVDGKIYKTKSEKIKVLKSDSPEKSSNESIYLSVFANKKKVFVGEPFKLTYKLYFKNKISNPQIVNFPSYSNFFKKEKEKKELTVESEEYRGEVFNSVILKEVVLIPQLSGKHLINNLEINLLEQIPINSQSLFDDPFDSFFRQTQTINRDLSSRKISIYVKDLPEEGKPTNFSGAIGEYELEFNVDKDTVNVGESIVLDLNLSGYGNLDFFDLPSLEFNTNQSITIYDPELSEKSNIYKNRTIKGEKKNKYIVIPTKSGFFETPKYEFSYFNTKEKKYKTINFESKSITVLGSEGKSFEEDFQETSSKNDTKKGHNKTIQLKTLLKYAAIFFSIFFLIFSALIIKKIVFISKKNKRLKTAKTAKKSIKKAFDAVFKNNKDPQMFKNELLKALSLYFSKRFYISQSSFSKENLKKELKNKNIPSDLINQTVNIFSKLELLNYSGIENLKISESIFKEAIDLINRLEHN